MSRMNLKVVKIVFSLNRKQFDLEADEVKMLFFGRELVPHKRPY